MSITKKQKIIAIVGTNASGKSALAVRLAKKLHGEVISADSRQVYRGLDIGSGKITKKEQRGVPHHLLDVASPRKNFTVVHFVNKASRAIKTIGRRGATPIVCGGTGFWIDALLAYPNLPAVKPNMELRKRLRSWTVSKLFSHVRTLDPKRAKSIDRNNPYRLIRAIEILRTTKKRIPARKEDKRYDVLYIGILLPKNILNERIKKRLRQRMRHGLIREVRRLHEYGLSWRRMEQLGLEYRYVSLFLQRKMNKNDMEQKLLAEIKKYAKRQRTWFRRNKNIVWVKNSSEAETLAKKFLRTPTFA